MTLGTLIDEARKLSHREQGQLLDELILMLGPEAVDVALTEAQEQDLDRRIDEYRSGRARTIPGDQAFDRLRKRL